MKPTIAAEEHYARLAERGDGRNDPQSMQSYMARWDGPQFYDMLGDLRNSDAMEVGIGVGRVAREVLNRGCRRLTGLDICSKALAAAGSDLAQFGNLELVRADIREFRREAAFDVAFSVLTFMHVADKPRALGNILASLRPGGFMVLSVDEESDSLDFGEWAVKLFPWRPEQYVETLERIGCRVAPTVPLIDTWVGPTGMKSSTYGAQVATLVKAAKP